MVPVKSVRSLCFLWTYGITRLDAKFPLEILIFRVGQMPYSKNLPSLENFEIGTPQHDNVNVFFNNPAKILKCRWGGISVWVNFQFCARGDDFLQPCNVPTMIERMTSMFPERLMTRFGWEA